MPPPDENDAGNRDGSGQPAEEDDEADVFHGALPGMSSEEGV